MRKQPPKLIGQLLLEEGLITESQLAHALQIQKDEGGKIVEILVGMGYFTPQLFAEFLAKQPGVASINLSNYQVSPDLINLVPVEFAIRHQVFPIDRMGRLLTLGMVCPLDNRTIQELEQQTGLRIKPLLCTPDDIRKAIERYYDTAPKEWQLTRPAQPTGDSVRDIEVPLRLANVARMLKLIERLPALPETVERLREMMADPDLPLGSVAKVIALDPPIVAKLLGVVNSAAYGMANRVDDLQLAVSLLGLQETYALVMSCSVVNIFEKSKRFDYRAFWLSSLCCASAARKIAQAAGHTGRFGVFAAGLLHDLGCAALSEVAPELYSAIEQQLPIPELLAEESRVLGITHAEAGYQLACKWGLPNEIAQPIRFHHTPGLATEARENVAIIALAAAIAGSASMSDAQHDAFEGLEPAFTILNLPPVTTPAMWEELKSRILDREDTPKAE